MTVAPDVTTVGKKAGLLQVMLEQASDVWIVFATRIRVGGRTDMGFQILAAKVSLPEPCDSARLR
jgi:hypothetical protein